MSGRKFPLVYDDEFDRDIHDLLRQTPQRRRSERIRTLIRLGVAAESTQAPPAHGGNKRSVTREDSPISPSSVVASPGTGQGERETNQRERKPHRFEPLEK